MDWIMDVEDVKLWFCIILCEIENKKIKVLIGVIIAVADVCGNGWLRF